MFDTLLEKLSKDIDSLQKFININEKLREIIEIYPSQCNTPELEYIRDNAPSSDDWRVHIRCASVTRIYAIYENFVENLVGEWVDNLPKLYPSCELLPETIKNTHRIGSTILLNDDNRRNRWELERSQIVRNLHITENSNKYKLTSAAFLLHDNNLRKEVLEKMLNSAGLNEAGASQIKPWDWIIKTPKIQELQKVIETELNLLIAYRNEAAHGNVTDELGIKGLLYFCDFVELLCQSVAEFTMCSFFSRYIEMGKLKEIGTITKYFPMPQAYEVNIYDDHLEVKKSLSVGKSVILLNETSRYCQKVVIENIRCIQNGREIDRRKIVIETIQIGLQFDKKAKKNSKIYIEI